MLEHGEREHEVEAGVGERQTMRVRDHVHGVRSVDEGIRRNDVRGIHDVEPGPELEDSVAARERLIHPRNAHVRAVIRRQGAAGRADVDDREVGVGNQYRDPVEDRVRLIAAGAPEGSVEASTALWAARPDHR